jgi:phosphoribosylamine--glycine ligase
MISRSKTQGDRRILVIGGAGREHALVWKLAQSPRVAKLYASPGSDAIGALAECVALKDAEAICAFAAEQRIDLTVVGPEAPLVEGLVDRLAERGLPAFGPTRRAAMLEGSKAFAKDFMRRHGIPTAPYAIFDGAEEAQAYLERTDPPFVVKADGLAAGKGVAVCRDRASAGAAVRAAMVEGVFGQAGARLVIEECLAGEEASYFAVCDGERFLAFPACQDHKPIGELDRGPNTGGMGAYCPTPLVTPAVERRIAEEIVRPTLRGMAAEGYPYRGMLYVGLMITPGGAPKVIEYNCRFGDPECQPLMMMLESDLLDILEAAQEEHLDAVRPRWRKGAAVCIVMASSGYPGSYRQGLSIEGLESAAASETLRVFHAGTAKKGGRWVTQGGRVLGVTAWGGTLRSALELGYRQVAAITWPGCTFRRDIGLKGLKWRMAERPDKNVGILLGSASDLEVAKKATDVLERLGVGYELAVASAHRTPERVRAFVRACEAAGVEVFIAIAGMAAALPGVVAAETACPVIGVPVQSAAFSGLDALLSVAQMPPGVPVAAVAVGGGVNAGLLAAQVLAVKYGDVRAALVEYRLQQAHQVEEAHRAAGLSTLI